MSALFLLFALTLVAPQDGARVPTRKPLRLAWQGGAEGVYLVSVRCDGGAEQLTAVSNRTDIYLANLELGTRYEWSVRLAGSLDEIAARFVTEDAPPRLLRAEGVRGFRDLGGGRTADGRRVRQNVLFRSAALREEARGDGRTGPGLEAGLSGMMSEFGIRTDVDLRPVSGSGESALGSGVRLRRIPFVAGRRIDQAVRGREPFVRIFDVLSDPRNHPVLFEASDEGREIDTLSFLLNGLLGVTEDDLRRGWTSSPELYRELSEYLKVLPGKTLAQRIETFARGCGIRAEEIESFRSTMLEQVRGDKR